MARCLLSLFAAVISSLALHASDVRQWFSPDHSIEVTARHYLENDRVDLGWDVVDITRLSVRSRTVASISLKEGSGIDRAAVVEAVWSPDSRFFVFQTNSTGGHSVWHWPTYVFDATTSQIYSIDDLLGPTTGSSDHLRVTSQETLILDFYNMDFEEHGGPYSFQKNIVLPDFVKKAHLALHSKSDAPHHR